MAGVLDTVDQRTRLVGENRLEILLFQLAGPQLFALNVFKIREVLTLPALTQMPQRHPHVVGVIHLRGQTIPVIDLSGAIGLQPHIHWCNLDLPQCVHFLSSKWSTNMSQ